MDTVDKILKRLSEPKEKTKLERYFDAYYAQEKEKKLAKKRALSNAKKEEKPVVLVKK